VIQRKSLGPVWRNRGRFPRGRHSDRSVKIKDTFARYLLHRVDHGDTETLRINVACPNCLALKPLCNPLLLEQLLLCVQIQCQLCEGLSTASR
jgi:hypothetical protein